MSGGSGAQRGRQAAAILDSGLGRRFARRPFLPGSPTGPRRLNDS